MKCFKYSFGFTGTTCTLVVRIISAVVEINVIVISECSFSRVGWLTAFGGGLINTGSKVYPLIFG